MKKTHLICFIIFSLLLVGCPVKEKSNDKPENPDPIKGLIIDASSDSIVKIPNEENVITIKNVKGKTVYLVRCNMDENASISDRTVGELQADQLRYVSETSIKQDSSGRGEKETSEETFGNHRNMKNDFLRSPLTSFPESNGRGFDESKLKDCDEKKHQFTKEEMETKLSKGLTKDFQFMDSEYKSRFTFRFKLMGVSEHGLLWIPDVSDDGTGHYEFKWQFSSFQEFIPTDKYTPDGNFYYCTKDIITNQMAQQILSKFETAYEYENEMFGARLNKIQLDDAFNTKDLEYFTEYGNFTNLLVCNMSSLNIFSDLSGCFWAKDYRIGIDHYSDDYLENNSQKVNTPNFQINGSSNEGSFLYLNTKYVSNNFSSDINHIRADFYETIVHEYMHSLQKARNVDNKQPQGNSAFSEMLAMLCEDAMYDVLEIPIEQSSHSSWLTLFIRRYISSGIMDFTYNMDNQFIEGSSTYGNVLAFGIFLTRNYGGLKLLGQMVRNEYDSWESIIHAIQTVKNVTVTKEQLMEQFFQSFLVKDSKYSTNKYSDSMIVNGKEFKNIPINLANLKENGTGAEKYDFCPDVPAEQVVLRFYPISDKKYNYGEKEAALFLRPQGGYHLCLIGKAENDAETITLTEGLKADYHNTYLVFSD